MKVLLIDDQRTVELADTTVRTFDEAIVQLTEKGPWDLVMIDHDLGDFDRDGRERTGYDILCFLEQHTEYVPHKIVIVSDNPVGRDRMAKVIANIQRIMHDLDRKERGDGRV